MVETQLCQLRDRSDTVVGRALLSVEFAFSTAAQQPCCFQYNRAVENTPYGKRENLLSLSAV